MAETSAELVEALAALGKVLLTNRVLHGDLQRIVTVAERSVPGCDGASVALAFEGRARTSAATDKVVLELDLAQHESDEGPCLLALREARPVRLDLIDGDTPFSTFAERAAQAGVRSSLSLPVVVDEEVVGTLNLYSYAETAFDATSQSLAAVMAAQAGAAIAKSRLLAAGRHAAAVAQRSADDRADVGMAEGMLMAVEQCTAQQAAALLRNAATSEEQTLAAMARRIIAEVDSHAPPPESDS